MYMGGMFVKDFRCSSNQDWIRQFHQRSWDYNLYNLGDQYPVMCSAQVFLLAIVPSLFPSKNEILTKTSQFVAFFLTKKLTLLSTTIMGCIKVSDQMQLLLIR